MTVTGTLARRSLRARWGRNIFIGLSILLGVSFVSGSFILADSMKATFTNLFSELSEDVDLSVRTSLAGVNETEATRDPLPIEVLDDVRAVPGVALAEGTIERFAQLLDPDGEPIGTSGAPALGVSWSGESALDGVVLKDGREPATDGEVAIDKSTADRAGYEVGDTISIVFDSGQQQFTIVGLVGLGDTDGFGGATAALFEPTAAQTILGADGTIDDIDIAVAEGADVSEVQAAIAEILPPRVEVVTGQQVADENADAINGFIDVFQTILLVFAAVIAFVAAFIINNIFGITIGQRLREVALLRSVGANAQQIRRLIVIEALAVSVVATLIGVFGGFGVAGFIISLFNAAGAGFPDTTLKLLPRTVVIGVIVGVGVTLVSVLIPARRASKIPPVAAMRPEAGFAALAANKRLAAGAVMTVGGSALFLIGLFVRPGGGLGMGLAAGLGALLIFIGISSLSSVVAGPASRTIGAPVEKLFGTPGKFARDNAARSPRRTARTAGALMIGVTLITGAAVLTASIRDTLGRILDQAITADYIVTDDAFLGLPPAIVESLAAVDEVGAVSPFRFIGGSINGDDVEISAVDPIAFPQLADLSVSSGDYSGLETGNGVMVLSSKAADLGLAVGDNVAVTYQNGVESTLTVSGLFDDDSLDGSWYISIDQLESISTQTPRDVFVLARLVDGADLTSARAAVEAAVAEFPQATVQDNREFRERQEDQLNQLLFIISALLGVAILISFIGIAITLALSVFERTREIGLLRAVGMNRRQLRRSIRWEAVIVAVFGVIVGVVVGIAMGVATGIALPNNVIDGISMPWLVIAFVLVLAVLAAMVAALYPAAKASKMDVLEAIATN